MSPEELFLSGRSPTHPLATLGNQGGRHVTWPIWRWRVVNGWKLQPALTTNFLDTSCPKRQVDLPAQSQYLGVQPDHKKGLWRARITAGGKLHHLGYFHNEELAACAYDCAAIQFRGVDAKLNFARPKA